MRTVGELSGLAGVTVRTLHHYDEIGLLCPSGRSDSGYRLYSHEDLGRLQEILVWRQLGFSLSEVQSLLDAALKARETGQEMEEDTMFENFEPSQHDDEVRERWGPTEAYRESTRRTASYGEREWRQIRAEADQVNQDFVALMKVGEPATSEPVRAVAECHRQHITRWFYPISTHMHRNLAEMYGADPRFAATYDGVALGLAVYIRDAVLANADTRAL